MNDIMLNLNDNQFLNIIDLHVSDETQYQKLINAFKQANIEGKPYTSVFIDEERRLFHWDMNAIENYLLLKQAFNGFKDGFPDWSPERIKLEKEYIYKTILKAYAYYSQHLARPFYPENKAIYDKLLQCDEVSYEDCVYLLKQIRKVNPVITGIDVAYILGEIEEWNDIGYRSIFSQFFKIIDERQGFNYDEDKQTITLSVITENATMNVLWDHSLWEFREGRNGYKIDIDTSTVVSASHELNVLTIYEREDVTYSTGLENMQQYYNIVTEVLDMHEDYFILPTTDEEIL